MSVTDVVNIKGKKISQVELSDDIFNVAVKSSVLHEVVKMQLAKKRAGTATVKNRSDIRGSTKKLFRQKGTGRARRGSAKSPLLRGGGVAFGPSNRSYAFKPAKKVRKMAMKMALSSKLADNELMILDKFELDEIKTKDFVTVTDTLNLNNALIITDKKNENLEISSRNVPNIKVMVQEGLNVYDILKYKNLVLLEASVKEIEGRLS